MIFYQKIFDMQLFERIRFFSKSKKVPLARLAEHIGVSPQTFNTWFSEKSQRNLWEHLQKILDLYPELSREWLYFGEGPMFKNEVEKSPPLASEPERDERLHHLEQENAELTKELRGALKDLRQLLAEKRELEEQLKTTPSFSEHHRDNPRSVTKGKPAPTAS